jgi:polyribonucleotide nucleotidyltransferase
MSYYSHFSATHCHVISHLQHHQVGLVIGKQGATIKGMQVRSGANIQIPPQPDADDPTRRTITITASTKESQDMAMREVQNIIDAGPIGGPMGMMNTSAPGSNTVLLPVCTYVCFLRRVCYMYVTSYHYCDSRVPS